MRVYATSLASSAFEVKNSIVGKGGVRWLESNDFKNTSSLAAESIQQVREARIMYVLATNMIGTLNTKYEHVASYHNVNVEAALHRGPMKIQKRFSYTTLQAHQKMLYK